MSTCCFISSLDNSSVDEQPPSGALEGVLDFGALGSYNLDLNFSPAVDPAVAAGILTGFDPGVPGLGIFMYGWSITAIPAPGALALLGLAGLGRRRRA